MISPLAYIDANAKIGKNVTIHPFAYIDKNVEIGDNCEIMPHVSVMSGTRMGSGNRVFQGSVLGAEPQDFKYKGEETLLVIGNDNVIRENVVINRATNSTGRTVVGNGNFIHEGVHISHDTKIGDHCVLGYGSKLSGNCQLEDCVIFGGNVLMSQGCRVGCWASGSERADELLWHQCHDPRARGVSRQSDQAHEPRLSDHLSGQHEHFRCLVDDQGPGADERRDSAYYRFYIRIEIGHHPLMAMPGIRRDP